MEKKDKTFSYSKTLKEILEKLNELDSRISFLESLKKENNSQLLNEVNVPEKVGLLGGKELLDSNNGLLRIIRVPCCDTCGKRLGEEFILCCNCRKKLCKECSISHENKTYCADCLRKILPISKKSYKVLVCVANDVWMIRKILKISKIKKKEIKVSLEELKNLNLIEKRRMVIFSIHRITHDGLVALYALKQIYGKDEDVKLFNSQLRNYLLKKSKTEVIT